MLKQLVTSSMTSSSRYLLNNNNVAMMTSQLRHISMTSANMRRNCPGQHKRLKSFVESYNDKWTTDLGTWSDKNLIVYPPTSEGIRPVEVYHGRQNCRYYPKKMYQVARFIRGMNVDEAIARLEHVKSRGSEIIVDVLKEAQEIAVRDNNVEFKSNMHVVLSFTNESGNIKFIRQHARSRDYINRMRFVNYYCMLREGPAPPLRPLLTSDQAADMYIDELRHRTIADGL